MIHKAEGQHFVSIDTTRNQLLYSDTAFVDDAQYYKGFKERTKKLKFGDKLYDALIDEPQIPVKAGENKPIESDYLPYAGKIIRKIKIIVLSPLGTDLNHPDTVVETSKFNESLNSLHVQTKEFTVRNNLQFEEGEPLNPLVVAETEAYLRGREYIYDVRITVEEVPLSDQVDVLIVVKDKFSLGLTIHSLSRSSSDVEIFHKNLFGLGARIDYEFVNKRQYDPSWGYGIGFSYQNIRRSFIDFSTSYLNNISSERWDFSVERKIQPSFEYFGQFAYSQNINKIVVVGWDSISPDFNEGLSFTFGKSIKLEDDNAIKRLVISGRYLQKSPEYRDISLTSKLLPYQFVKNRLWLAQLSVYKQAYYREYLIHNFGVTEDVAHGYNFSFQGGYGQFSDYSDGLYASATSSFGRFFKTGNYYLYTSISSYFNKDEAFEGVLKLEGRYFSPLKQIGRNRFRHFVNISYNRLLNPIRKFDHVIYFSDVSTLDTRDFRDEARGVERLSVNLESDMFSRFNLAGFRFLFYSFGDFGWITPDKNLFDSQHFNCGFGLGIRIRNNILVFKTIDIKFGFYPNFSQSGTSDYFNIKTSDPKVSPSFVPDYPREITLE